MKNYVENRETLILKGKSRGKPFNDAVQRLEDYMSNRVVREINRKKHLKICFDFLMFRIFSEIPIKCHCNDCQQKPPSKNRT